MSKVGDLIQRGDYLFGQRGSLLSMWQDVALNFYPERADFLATRAAGDAFASHLNSSYPLIVQRELSNSFGSMLRPRDQEWFSLTVEREEKLDRAGREWLENASGIQRRAMYDRVTQFVRATKEGDKDFAAFGQCVISVDMNWEKNALLYRNWHLRDVAWAERYDGTTPETHHNLKMSARDLVRLFPKTCHGNVRKHVEKEPYRQVSCRRIVMESEDYDDKNLRRFPFVSVYLDVENQHILEEIGSWTKIYVKPRWQTVSGSAYAYSPAVVAGLPDARMLQAMTLTLLEAGEWSLRPPLLARKDAIQGEVGLFAGAVTAVDMEYDERFGEVVRPITQDRTGIPFGVDLVRDTREQLATAFYLNKLSLPPSDGGQMTAYEMGQRIQEYIRNALPLFEPMEMEYNGEVCEISSEILMGPPDARRFSLGAFGPATRMPESLRGMQTRFKFASPLHEAIERKKGQVFMEAKGLVREAIEIDPSSLPILNVRTALRDALNGIGIPAKWTRDEEEVEARAEQAAEQQQAESETRMAGAGAAVAEQVGKAQQALSEAA